MMDVYDNLNPLEVSLGRASVTKKCDLFIAAIGFEDRALAFIERANIENISNIVLLRYTSSIKQNDINYEKALDIIQERKFPGKVTTLEFSVWGSNEFEKEFINIINSIQLNVSSEVWLDVSAMPLHIICVSLRIIRFKLCYNKIVIFYAAAKHYYPTRKEYDKINAYIEREKSVAIPPSPSMSTEMKENIILDVFSGCRLKEHATVLVLFAGYEIHRSFGVVDHVNPTRLVIMYGAPGDRSMSWRERMSRILHKNIASRRLTSEETVSTLSVSSVLSLLDDYYQNMFDDHNFSIAPVCSKMQAVASYLFWENKRDVQLVFPLPINYLPTRFSSGVKKTYCLALPEMPGLVGYGLLRESDG